MKKDSVASIKKKFDVIFSLYIRWKYADYRGYVKCYTCPVIKPVQQMQNGHYISRNVLVTRFDEENCRPQCVGCNIFKKGNYPEYAIQLEREKKGTLEKLDKIKNKQVKYSTIWYAEKIKEYKNKLKDIQSL